MKKQQTIVPDTLFGRTKQEILDFCLSHEFPGTDKWPADHPIWDCSIAQSVSPRFAWTNSAYLTKAINNLYWITYTSIVRQKYKNFTDGIERAFSLMDEQPMLLLRAVLTRFTVAKIAPKVTALAPNTLLQAIEESNIDLSSGVYCPMAGFGGIIEGTKRWFSHRHIDSTNKIEAYDINESLCSWYGWTVRDALAQTIYTDKVVIACPPFGPNTERWLGTPECMYYEFHEWCELLKQHIVAPNYIFIGPELSSDTSRVSLFRKKLGVSYYPEYSIKL